MKRAERIALVIFILCITLLWSMMIVSAVKAATPESHEDPVAIFQPRWQKSYATWYGPRFYGKTTKCGQRYTIRIEGIAARDMSCGTKLTVCYFGRCERIRVIDGGGKFDLSARTAMDLCQCWKPYSMHVRWHHGWNNRSTPREAS